MFELFFFLLIIPMGGEMSDNQELFYDITDDKTKQELLVKQINKISADLLLETKTSDVLLFLNPSYCDKIAYII